MRVRVAAVGTALVSALAPLLALAPVASAGQQTFSISVEPTTVELKDTFTVTGTNGCATSPYTVTFVYTRKGGDGTVEATGTTDDSGGFTEEITVPEEATPEQPASVQATVECQPVGASRQGAGSTQTSNTVAVNIVVADGVLSTDKTSGKAGTVVQVTGTNCLGDEVVVVFGNKTGASRVPVTLAADDTFAGSYTIPSVPPGPYFFAASCPGTDYADRAFTVLVTPGAPVVPPVAPPPAPVVGPVNFAG
jgi:hypothetical protein